MEIRIYINFLLMGSECPGIPHSVCNSGKCECRQPVYESSVNYPHMCERRKSCGLSCESGNQCYVGLTCVNITTLEKYCLCPSGQFGYQTHTRMCRSVSTLHAENLRLNGPHSETQLSLVWDPPLNVSDPLTYRMEINGTENITSISGNMYILINRQPGTLYQIQIHISTIKHCGIIEEKIENDNPLQRQFCTKPAVPGSLATNIYLNTSVTLQFHKSDGHVESYFVTVTANASRVSSRISQNQSISSEGLGDWRYATFYNLVPGELYDVKIKAISCTLESEERKEFFIINLKAGATCNPRLKDPQQCEANTVCQDVGGHYECVLDHPSDSTPTNEDLKVGAICNLTQQCEANTVCQDVGGHYECVLDHPSDSTPSNEAGDSGVVIALGVLSAVLFIVCTVLAVCVYTMNKKLRTIQLVQGPKVY